jgi:hypothetical protein
MWLQGSHVFSMAGKPIVKTRTRFGKYPVPSERADLHWSKEQAGDYTAGQLAAMLIESDAFQDVFMPKLKQIDERNLTLANRKSMGRPLRWSALQLESVLVYRRMAGTETLKEAWARLHSEPKSRLLLGLGERIPSRATLSRYIRQHFDEHERCALHLELDKRSRQPVVQLDGFDQEARILGMDGSKHGTHFTPPIPKASKGKRSRKKKPVIVNAEISKGEPGAITAPTAGYVGGNNPKSGQGWQFMGLWSEHGALLSWEISALNESEKPAGERVLASYRDEVLPHRARQVFSVLSADAGFNSQKIRGQAQAMGIVPNIPKASHKEVPGLPETKTANATKRNNSWHRFKFPEKLIDVQ